MPFRQLLATMLLVASLTNTGCYSLTIQSDADVPLLITGLPSGDKAFHAQARVYYLAWGLIDTRPSVVADLLSDRDALKAINVSSYFDVWSALAFVATLGVLSSRVVDVEGTPL